MRQIKIAITGDLNISGSFENKIRKNVEIFSKDVLDILHSADYCICNLEGPVTDKSKPKDSFKTNLKSPLNTISYLSERNIKIFNLANNHCLDFGEKGLADTINEIKRNNCQYFGASNTTDALQNNILFGDFIKIQIQCFTEKIRNNNTQIAYKKHLKPNIANWNIIIHHGGEEYSLYPSPTKRNLLNKIRKKYNPDIIISHHSHTLQGVEQIKNTSVFYSLGNFIFDIDPHYLYKYTNESAILLLTFTETQWQYEILPIQINRENGVIESGNKNITERFKEISDFSGYKSKWRKEAYRVLIKRNASALENKQDAKPLYKMRKSELIFSLEFYKKSIKILFDRNSRSLYWNALIYKLFYAND